MTSDAAMRFACPYESPAIAAALAMRTERVRIGFAVVQMPFHHPVRLATQLALLDNLSKGRIDVGIGKGTVYNEYEFVGHGLRSDDSRERMEEAVDILSRAGGRFDAGELPHHDETHVEGIDDADEAALGART